MDVIESIIENASMAKEQWSTFLSEAPAADREALRVNFHLRPTSDGVTVVSLLPEAPMRGIDTIGREALCSVLEKIKSERKGLTAEKSERRRQALSDCGFGERKTAGEREENIQARMIHGMLLGRPQYEGITFVTSELTIKKGNRFDIVGLKGETLYLFELKARLTENAFSQVERYKAHVAEHREEFKRLLEVYPGGPFRWKEVRGISVLPYAENSSLNGKPDVWFYESGLDFFKP